MKLIDKDALAAKVEKHRAIWDGMDGDYCEGQRMAYSDVISILDKIEVKEVDLNKEIHKFIDKEELHLRLWDVDRIAKHFFELGLKAQKGEQLYTPKEGKGISIEREVKVDAGGYPYIPQIELYDYEEDVPLAKAGDKVKVIIMIK